MGFGDLDSVFQLRVKTRLYTPLIIKSGQEGELTDSLVQKTPDNRVHIGGYPLSSLFVRAFKRLKNNRNIHERIDTKGDKVSQFWVESSFIDGVEYNIVPGIKIDRRYGTASETALYSDEVVSAGHEFEMRINFLFNQKESNFCDLAELFSQGLGVIDSGIENIGGYWSYGYGRLKIVDAKYRVLDLKKGEHTGLLWNFADESLPFNELVVLPPTSDSISEGWYRIEMEFEIPDGQLFAIHSDMLPLEIQRYPKLPDRFLFHTRVKDGDGYKSLITVPGKAIRQAIFSYHLERFLRSRGEKDCQLNKGKEECNCIMCRIFGSSSSKGAKRGIISVSDGYIEENDNTVVLSRLSVDEHTFQSVNLFSEEYIVGGNFRSTMFIDKGSKDFDLCYMDYIKKILSWLSDRETHPPNWFRMGANSTCSGIVNLKAYHIDEV